ncbi:hypothetical protein B0H17DRAFT_1187690 [Mycena rosella]|uniref:Uncharacterized protein n=1 Tax=Mycena rosella TaxID=1033263 RepID=A0AAD7FM16_MYCRO|nr:hypothetical protein B0H17DRAFT_1187690 [Mycena rosella]
MNAESDEECAPVFCTGASGIDDTVGQRHGFTLQATFFGIRRATKGAWTIGVILRIAGKFEIRRAAGGGECLDVCDDYDLTPRKPGAEGGEGRIIRLRVSPDLPSRMGESAEIRKPMRSADVPLSRPISVPGSYGKGHCTAGERVARRASTAYGDYAYPPISTRTAFAFGRWRGINS